MIHPAEAGQKIAAANAGIQQAKMARPSPGQEAKVKTAERRLAVLLTPVSFSGRYRSNSGYQAELAKMSKMTLNGHHRRGYRTDKDFMCYPPIISILFR
jgi:hypothetical protein